YANCDSNTHQKGACSQATDFSQWWLTMAGTPLPSVEEEDALDLRLTKVAQFLGATLAPQSSLPTELPAGCQLFGLFPALLSSQGFLAPAQPSETARVFLEWLQEQSGQ
ncbi:hypothetical protein OF390_09560, partial [Limosilactobacillus fermentum]|nr:hypothetical protein [Limosilactobacillus fermentum]